MTISRRTALAQLLAVAAPSAFFARDAFAQSQYRYDALGRLRCVAFDDGSRVQYEYDAAGNRTTVVRAASGTFTATVPITGTGPVNLRSLATAAGYDGLRNASITFTLASNITITGVAGAPAGGIAIDTGDWPVPNCPSFSLTLALQISGKVYGGGGRGSMGASPGGASVAGAGGDAVHCRTPISITVNSGGEVKAGGGGGGGGGGWFNNQTEFEVAGGGGGGGFPNGTGGAPGASNVGSGATAGANGTTSGGGAAGAGDGAFDGHAGGAGGVGGPSGSIGGGGQASTGSTGSGWQQRNFANGAAAGFAIRKNGHSVPVTNNGTITGTVS